MTSSIPCYDTRLTTDLSMMLSMLCARILLSALPVLPLRLHKRSLFSNRINGICSNYCQNCHYIEVDFKVDFNSAKSDLAKTFIVKLWGKYFCNFLL